jgi:hypothetical protein
MPGVQVVAEIRRVYRFAGQKSLYPLGEAVVTAAGCQGGCSLVLGTDRGDGTVEDGSELALGKVERGAVYYESDLSTLRHDEVAECRIAGEVAAQDGLKSDAIANGVAGLSEHLRRDRATAVLALGDRGEGIVDGRDEGRAKPLYILRIFLPSRSVDSVNASKDRLVDFGSTVP